jgi:hypothetical protein
MLAVLSLDDEPGRIPNVLRGMSRHAPRQKSHLIDRLSKLRLFLADWISLLRLGKYCGLDWLRVGHVHWTLQRR